jgi:hypothetical protein
VIEVRHFGYEVAELPVDLRSEATTTRDVHLRRAIVTLDSMRIVATRSKYPEFVDHQKFAVGGIFLGPERHLRRRRAADRRRRDRGVSCRGDRAGDVRSRVRRGRDLDEALTTDAREKAVAFLR